MPAESVGKSNTGERCNPYIQLWDGSSRVSPRSSGYIRAVAAIFEANLNITQFIIDVTAASEVFELAIGNYSNVAGTNFTVTPIGNLIVERIA